MATINLVQGDNLPYIDVALTDAVSGVAIDLSGADVTIKFRAAGAPSVLATLPCTKPGGAGKIRFYFPGTTLNVAPGAYEGEIELSFGGLVQTVYKPLKFNVRAQF